MQRRLCIIGAGRAGCALGFTLRQRGWVITACWSRSRERAEGAATSLGATPLWGASTLSRACVESVILLGVVDDAIPTMATALAPLLEPDQTLLHLSGSVSSSALAVPGMRAQLGGLHPLQALSDDHTLTPEQLAGAFVAVEGHPSACLVAEALARDLGCRVARVDTTRKAAYHAAAVIVSNHLVALFDAGLSLMAHAGIPADMARDMLLPLARGTLENLSLSPPERALTGPIRRGDVATIAAHIEALQALSPAVRALYLAGLPATLELAERADAEGLDALRALIAEVAPTQGSS